MGHEVERLIAGTTIESTTEADGSTSFHFGQRIDGVGGDDRHNGLYATECG